MTLSRHLPIFVDMENRISQTRELGYMILAFTAVGLVGMALVAIVEPGIHRGLMRFLSLIVLTSGILMSLMWTGYVSMRGMNSRLGTRN